MESISSVDEDTSLEEDRKLDCVLVERLLDLRPSILVSEQGFDGSDADQFESAISSRIGIG